MKSVFACMLVALWMGLAGAGPAAAQSGFDKVQTVEDFDREITTVTRGIERGLQADLAAGDERSQFLNNATAQISALQDRLREARFGGPNKDALASRATDWIASLELLKGELRQRV